MPGGARHSRGVSRYCLHGTLPDTREFSRLTKLENRAELLEDMLRGDIDPVMYGHEHDRYLGNDTYRELITDTHKRRALSKNG